MPKQRHDLGRHKRANPTGPPTLSARRLERLARSLVRRGLATPMILDSTIREPKPERVG